MWLHLRRFEIPDPPGAVLAATTLTAGGVGAAEPMKGRCAVDERLVPALASGSVAEGEAHQMAPASVIAVSGYPGSRAIEEPWA